MGETVLKELYVTIRTSLKVKAKVFNFVFCNTCYYYLASSSNGQDGPNPAL